MARKTAPRTPRQDADQRIWSLAYHQGYDQGYADGLEEGEQDFQAWLLAELVTLAQDIRLGLRHDIQAPLDVVAAVTAVVHAGRPTPVDWVPEPGDAG